FLPNIKDINPNYSLRSGYEDSFLGHSFTYGHFFTPREDNTWRAAANASWTPRPQRKFKLFASKRIQINQGFLDPAIGDYTQLTTSFPLARRYALDRYTTQLDDQNTMSLSWTEAFGRAYFQELRLAGTYNGEQRDENGKK